MLVRLSWRRKRVEEAVESSLYRLIRVSFSLYIEDGIDALFLHVILVRICSTLVVAVTCCRSCPDPGPESEWPAASTTSAAAAEEVIRRATRAITAPTISSVIVHRQCKSAKRREWSDVTIICRPSEERVKGSVRQRRSRTRRRRRSASSTELSSHHRQQQQQQQHSNNPTLAGS